MIERVRIILLRLTIIEAGTVGAVTDGIALLNRAKARCLSPPEGIQCHAIGVGHGAGIVGGLHSPLDLKAVYAGVPEFRQMLDHAQVFGVQDKGAPVF